jgi:hypothetical protein
MYLLLLFTTFQKVISEKFDDLGTTTKVTPAVSREPSLLKLLTPNRMKGVCAWKIFLEKTAQNHL